MKSYNELVELSNIDINLLVKEELDIIDNLKVSQKQEVQKKIHKTLHDMNNPYCFICKGIIVKVEYANTETSLEEIVTSFLIRKKQE